MTGCTVGRQIQLGMVRILTLCIVIAMTTVTGIGCIVVISVVACRTVSGDIQVSPRQYIEIIVNSECSWLPCRRGVTTGAIG